MVCAFVCPYSMLFVSLKNGSDKCMGIRNKNILMFTQSIWYLYRLQSQWSSLKWFWIIDNGIGMIALWGGLWFTESVFLGAVW